MNFIILLDVFIGLLLSFCILLQHRASGLSATFGGAGTVPIQRRGAEKVLFVMTIWLAVVFFALALLNLILGQ